MSSPTTESTAPSRIARYPARAETVGSLLRPPRLWELYADIFGGKDTQVVNFVDDDVGRARLRELQELADAEIKNAVARQIEVGLDVVSDGEMRRALFENSLYESISGIAPNPRHADFTDEEHDHAEPPSTPKITGKVRKVGNTGASEAEFLAGITDHPFKVTFPAASMLLYPTTGLDSSAYATRDEMVADMIGIYRQLVAETVEAGCRYIQFDWPIYPLLIDRRSSQALAELGENAETLLSKAIAADRAVCEGVPEEVTVGLHLCRGNYRSHWFLEGALDAVAERVFTELPYDTFLFEWEDTERQGGYAPIRFVQPGKIMVMGIVSSKVPELETEDDLMRRMDEAAGYLDMSQLAISPQCGFASVWEGNEITEDVQWRKLELVSRVADRIWG